MRKRIHIFVLLMATLALVTNILIPHHHHGDKICFIDFQCDAECEHEDHSNTEHNHDAEGTGDHQNCMLDLEVILPYNPERSLTEDIIDFGRNSDFDGCTALLVNELNKVQLLQRRQISHAPLILQFYSHTVIGSPGLRAPPSC